MKKRATIITAISVLILVCTTICVILISKYPRQIVTNGSQDQGLTFRVDQVSPTGVTVEYDQKGGDVKGELVIRQFGIYLQEDYKYVLEINKLELLRNITLQLNSRGSFEIDWTQAYDHLKPGKYYLQLSVDDRTDPASGQFSDHESYYIPFTIR